MSVDRGDFMAWATEILLLAGFLFFIWWMYGDYIGMLWRIMEWAPR